MRNIVNALVPCEPITDINLSYSLGISRATVSNEQQQGALQSMEELKFVQYSSALKQKEIIDALSILYEKFPVASFRDCRLYADNREFWATYDRRKHGAKGLRIEDLSCLVTFALAEMAKYRGNKYKINPSEKQAAK